MFCRAFWIGLFVASAFGAPAHAQQVHGWGEFAIVSTTASVWEGRVCVGLEGRAIACPTYAPSLTTAGDVSVTGNLSASRFLGDGSGLTGVSAASSDRIVSGTNNATSMLAISSSGYISITQAGANSAWFDPTKGLVALGVSTTGGISSTNGYFMGKMGIGTLPSTTAILTVNGNIDMVLGYSFGGLSYGQFTHAGNILPDYGVRWYSDPWSVNGPTGSLASYGGLKFFTSRLLRMGITEYGNVGINVVTPTTKLEVNGTISATALYVTGSTGVISV
jgi:hypothetical protein